MNKIDLALSIATKAHAGQTDRDGEAYILHPLTVGLMGRTDEERMAGFLHDVIEDTSYTENDLVEAGIPVSVVNALKILTHDKSTPYYDYVQRIIDSRNPIALRTKFNDLTHNYNRGKKYPDLQKKHGKALEMVKAAIESVESVSLYNRNVAVKGNLKVVAFAAGCFWGVQHYMAKQQGVINTYVGYTGGEEPYPTYEDVRSHQTSHLEAVLVEYDEEVVTYEELCKLFFEIHDPGQLDGQGPDKGQQYLSGIFYTDSNQKNVTEKLISILKNNGYEVNTRIETLGDFWIAEQYHQNYYANTGGNPYCHFRTKKFEAR